MSFDKDNSEDVKRLVDAIDYSQGLKKPFAMVRLELLKEFVGNRYSETSAPRDVPLNFIAMDATVLTRFLAAENPRVMVTARDKGMRPDARDLEIGMNDRIKEMDLGSTIAMIVLDAMFCVGIAKIGNRLDGTIRSDEGAEIRTTRPFISRIDFDDLIIDMAAEHIDNVQFIGHRYRIPYEHVKDRKDYDKEARESQKPEEVTSTNPDGTPRTSSISQGSTANRTEFMPTVEQREVFLTQDQLIVTMTMEGKVLKAAKWKGPKHGPYRWLSFQDVPGQLIPKGHLHDIADLHDLENNMLRKAIRRAHNDKDILVADVTNPEEATRIMNAEDQGVIASNQPGQTKQFHTGGIKSDQLAAIAFVKDLFSWAAGNINALGGLARGSDTARQDQQQLNSASGKTRKMQSQTAKFAKFLVEDLAHWMVRDTLDSMTIEKPTGFRGGTIVKQFKPRDLKKKMISMVFEIDAYSMQDISPGEKLGQIFDVFREIYSSPLFLQEMERQGAQFNIKEFQRVIVKLTQREELNNILEFPGLPREESAGGGEQRSNRPAVTHRINERISRKGEPEGGISQDILQAAFSGKSAPAKEEAVG